MIVLFYSMKLRKNFIENISNWYRKCSKLLEGKKGKRVCDFIYFQRI